MSEEKKAFAAVGTFADTGEEIGIEVPADSAELCAKIEEIFAKYDAGDVLDADDQAIVKAYLPAIGSEETSLSADNALVGGGHFAFERSELGCDMAVEGFAGCQGVGEGRIEWCGDMSVRKAGGDTRVSGLEFTFYGISFGTGPSGSMRVLYKREFARPFDGVDTAAASFFDRYAFVQWGYYFAVKCEVKTEKGTFVIG